MDEKPLTSGQEGPDLLGDCRIMLRFAREAGAELPPESRHDIGELDEILLQLGQPAVSELPAAFFAEAKAAAAAAGVSAPALPQATGAAAGAQPDAGAREAQRGAASPTTPGYRTQLVLKVHGALSKLVAPATALTLRATEPPPGNKSVFSRMPRVVKLAAFAALLSAIGFVVSSAFIAKQAAKPTGSSQEQSKPAADAAPVPSTTAPAAAVKEGGAKP